MILSASKYVYPGILALLAAGCASTPEVLRREPASNSRADAIHCLQMKFDEGNLREQTFERNELARVLRLSPENIREAGAISALKASAYRQTLLKSLLDAELEGEALVAEFQKWINAGRTLEEIDETTTVYSRLQALRYFMETVQDALVESYKNETVRKVRGGLSEPMTFDSRILARGADEIFEREQASVLRETGVSAESAAHAFHDLGKNVRESQIPYSACASTAQESPTPTTRTLRPLVQATVRTDLNRLRSRPRVIRVDAFIRGIAREQEGRKAVEKALVTRPRVHYPDSGKPGNVTGNTFPQGAWAMTYDDGPGQYTETLIDRLKERGVLATFFVQGSKFDLHPGVVAELREAGHSVNSHSHNHPVVPELDAAGRERQIAQAVRELNELLGETTRFYRLPYGAGVSLPSIRQRIADAGLIHVFWNVDTLDWKIKTVDGILENTLKQVAVLRARGLNRGVILFHDTRERTVGYRDEKGQWVDGASLRTLSEVSVNSDVKWMTVPQIVDQLNGD